jgi:hypothetical protein
MASFGAAAQSSDVTYTYDALGRLVGADYSSSNSTITYTYDAAGNRTSVVTTAPNQPPIAVDDSYTQQPGTSVLHNVLENDVDPEGVPLSIANETGADASISGSQILFDAPVVAGPYAFDYTVSDGTDVSAPATVTITVPNVAPVATDDTGSQLEGLTKDYDVLSNDSDANNNTLTLTNVTGSQASIVSNQVRFNATSGPGSYAVNYTVSDGNLTDTATLTVTVTANQTWSWSPTIPTQTPDEGVSYALDLSTFGSDPEGDPVTYAATGLPAGLSVVGSSITGTATESGTFSVTVDATDSGSSTAVSTSFSMNVTAAPNQSWSWSQTIPTQTPDEGVSYALDLSTFGSDPEGDSVTYAATGLPAGLSVVGSSITGTPTENGAFSVSADATDSGSNTAVSTSFSMNVTAAPNQSWSWSQTIPTQSPDEGVSYALDLSTFGSDPEGDPVTYTATGLPAGLSVAGSSITGTPTENGSFSVSVDATDSGSNTAVSTSFSMNVTAASGSQPAVLLFTDQLQNGATLWAGSVSDSEISVAGEPVYSGTHSVKATGGHWNQAGMDISTSGLNASNGLLRFRIYRDAGSDGHRLALRHDLWNTTRLETTNNSHWSIDGQPANGIEDLAVGTWHLVEVDLVALGISTISAFGVQGNGGGGDVYYIDDVALWPTAGGGSPPPPPPPPNLPWSWQTIPTQPADEGVSYSLLLTDFGSDPENEIPTFAATGLPQGLGVVGSSITGTPTENGAFTININATDGGSGQTTATSFSMNVTAAANLPWAWSPSISVPDADEGVSYSLNLMNLGSDPENEIPTFAATGLPQGLGVVGTSITGTPTESGSFTITVNATDSGSGQTTSTTFNMNVTSAGGPQPAVLLFDDQLQNGATLWAASVSDSEISVAGEPVYSGTHSVKATGGHWNQAGLDISTSGLNATNGLLRFRIYREVGSDGFKFALRHDLWNTIRLEAVNNAHWSIDGQAANGIEDLTVGTWHLIEVDLVALGISTISAFGVQGNGGGGDVYYIDDVALWPTN